VCPSQKYFCKGKGLGRGRRGDGQAEYKNKLKLSTYLSLYKGGDGHYQIRHIREYFIMVFPPTSPVTFTTKIFSCPSPPFTNFVVFLSIYLILFFYSFLVVYLILYISSCMFVCHVFCTYPLVSLNLVCPSIPPPLPLQ
jgi:hypothetical protein